MYGGSTGLVVIGGDSRSEVCGFKSSEHFFTYICCKNFNVYLRRQNKFKRGRVWPIFEYLMREVARGRNGN